MSLLVATPGPRSRRRRGLTLMELVVVLTILAALAAIMIPLFPNLLRRAHKATDATQTSEVSKAVQLYWAVNIGFPDEWDLMTVSTGTTAPDFLPNDAGTPFGGAATVGNLTAAQVSALNRVGVTNGHHFVATLGAANHPTLNPYSAPVTTPTPLSATTPVFLIDNASTNIPIEIQNIIARNIAAGDTPRFVVFGVGTRSQMVGNVMQNAPTSVPQNKDFTPATHYSRVGVIFQVAGTGIDTPGGTNRAKFLGAVALEDDELESTEKDLVNYYDIARTGQ